MGIEGFRMRKDFGWKKRIYDGQGSTSGGKRGFGVKKAGFRWEEGI